MSGIAGIVRFDEQPIDRQRLGAMLDRLSHRGPDGTGVALLERCSLGAARLSIIDLFSAPQPMHFESDATVGQGLNLVYNGEIYNHRELRKKLVSRGHVFRYSHSDTEVLLRGYLEWGDQLPKHLQGMWAFAVWDRDRRELFLCRDRVGAKPLYLRRSDDELRFGSIVSAVLAGRPKDERVEHDPVAVQNFLQLGHAMGGSLVAGIEELPPAHCLTVHADGSETLTRFWRPPPISKSSTSLGAVDALREVIGESVRQRLLADVPLGAVINGGLDAAVVAVVAQRIRTAEGEPPLKTLSLSLEGIDDQQASPGTDLAKHLKTDHTLLSIRPGDIATDLRDFIESQGEPLADVSLLRTIWLCRAAKEQVQVLLTGNGGAELFGGWHRYRMMGSLARHLWWIKKLPRSTQPRSASRQTRINRLREAAASGGQPASHYLSLIRLFSASQIQTLAPQLMDKAATPLWGQLPDWTEQKDQAHAAMRWDLMHGLPYRGLRRVDRASMRVALEVRMPFLGTPVLDLAGHLPSSVLMPHNRPMGLLSQVAEGLLPASAIRRYRPFQPLPLAQWLRGPLSDSAFDYFASDRLSRLGISNTAARKYLDEHLAEKHDHHPQLFALLQLAMWSDWLSRQ